MLEEGEGGKWWVKNVRSEGGGGKWWVGGVRSEGGVGRVVLYVYALPAIISAHSRPTST